MRDVDRERLAALEQRLGEKIPAEFMATLTSRVPIREGNVALVIGDRIRDVRTTFRLDASEEDDQIHTVYRLAWDAVPPKTLPFAEVRVD